MFPRRRSFSFKLLFLIPASWFLITILTRTHIDLGGQVESGERVPAHSQLISSSIVNYSAIKSNNRNGDSNVYIMSNDNNGDNEIDLNGDGYNSNGLASGGAAAPPPLVKNADDSEMPVNEETSKSNLIDLSAYDSSFTLVPPAKDESGEMGKAVILPRHLTPSIKKLVDKGWQDNAFNQYVSDLIPIQRSLPDVRDPKCRDIKYHKNLPSTSVIICFHNEAWTVLLRTIHSVLDRSPKHLIHEIILVDDYSDREYLKAQLEDYIRQFNGIVKVVRAKKREGLIRARLLGFQVATGPTVTYLDSHCEVCHLLLISLLPSSLINTHFLFFSLSPPLCSLTLTLAFHLTASICNHLTSYTCLHVSV